MKTLSILKNKSICIQQNWIHFYGNSNICRCDTYMIVTAQGEGTKGTLLFAVGSWNFDRLHFVFPIALTLLMLNHCLSFCPGKFHSLVKVQVPWLYLRHLENLQSERVFWASRIASTALLQVTVTVLYDHPQWDPSGADTVFYCCSFYHYISSW